MTQKAIARQVIARLPERASLDEIIHALYVRAKFAGGEREVREGRGVPHGKARQRLRKVLKAYDVCVVLAFALVAAGTIGCKQAGTGRPATAALSPSPPPPAAPPPKTSPVAAPRESPPPETVNFLGLPENQEEVESYGHTTMTKVREVEYAQYLGVKQEGSITVEELHDNWVYFATEDHVGAYVDDVVHADIIFTTRYKARLPEKK